MMTSALQLIDLPVLKSGSKRPEQPHQRAPFDADHGAGAGAGAPNSSTPLAPPASPAPPPPPPPPGPAEREPPGAVTLSSTARTRARKGGRRSDPYFFNYPVSLKETLMLIAKKMKQPSTTNRSANVYKKTIKESIKHVDSQARRLRTQTQSTTSVRKQITRASKNEIDLLKLLRDAITRRKAVSVDAANVKTPLTDALRNGIVLIELFERGKVAQRQFIEDWQILNEIIQDAKKNDQYGGAHSLNEPLKALQGHNKTAKWPEMNAASLLRQLQSGRTDMHFVAYRYRPTTRSQGWRTTKTYKIYAAYKESNNSATQEEKTDKREKYMSMTKGPPKEIDSQEEESEESEENSFHQAQVPRSEKRPSKVTTAVKGFKVANEMQDRINSSDAIEDDIPWKEGTLVNSDTDEKYSTSKPTPTPTPTPLVQVEWVTQMRTDEKEGTPKEDPNGKVQQDGIIAQRHNGKTSQEQEYEEVLQNFNKLRQRNYDENFAQTEQTPENVEVDILVSKDAINRAIGESYIKKVNIQIDPQEEIMDSLPEEVVNEHPDFFVLKDPVKESHEMSVLIEKTLQSNENTAISDSIVDTQEQLPVRRSIDGKYINRKAPGKKKSTKTIRTVIGARHVTATIRNDAPVRAQDNAGDWDKVLDAAIRRTEVRSARYGGAGGAGGGKKQKSARNASSDRTIIKRGMKL